MKRLLLLSSLLGLHLVTTGCGDDTGGAAATSGAGGEASGAGGESPSGVGGSPSGVGGNGVGGAGDTPMQGPGCGDTAPGSVLLEDDFQGGSIDPSIWSVLPGSGGTPPTLRSEGDESWLEIAHGPTTETDYVGIGAQLDAALPEAGYTLTFDVEIDLIQGDAAGGEDSSTRLAVVDVTDDTYTMEMSVILDETGTPRLRVRQSGTGINFDDDVGLDAFPDGAHCLRISATYTFDEFGEPVLGVEVSIDGTVSRVLDVYVREQVAPSLRYVDLRADPIGSRPPTTVWFDDVSLHVD
jgi:hypothetical protein